MRPEPPRWRCSPSSENLPSLDRFSAKFGDIASNGVGLHILLYRGSYKNFGPMPPSSMWVIMSNLVTASVRAWTQGRKKHGPGRPAGWDRKSSPSLDGLTYLTYQTALYRTVWYRRTSPIFRPLASPCFGGVWSAAFKPCRPLKRLPCQKTAALHQTVWT